MTASQLRLRIGIALLITALSLATAVTGLGEPAFDASAVHEARSLRDGLVGDVMHWASRVGYVRFLGPATVALAVVVALASRRTADALVVATSTLVASALNGSLKLLFTRDRPSDGIDLVAAGFSMPSGHAAASAAFAASLAIAAPAGGLRVLAAIAGGCFAGLVGVSRIVLGVHYPTDVLAGWCVGVGVTLVASRLLPPRRGDVPAAR